MTEVLEPTPKEGELKVSQDDAEAFCEGFPVRFRHVTGVEQSPKIDKWDLLDGILVNAQSALGHPRIVLGDRTSRSLHGPGQQIGRRSPSI